MEVIVAIWNCQLAASTSDVTAKESCRGTLTIERIPRAPNGILAVLRILRLPDRPHAINLRMMEVKARITWANERIVLQPTHREMAVRVKRRCQAVDTGVSGFPAVDAFEEANEVRAGEEVLLVAEGHMAALLQLKVAG